MKLQKLITDLSKYPDNIILGQTMSFVFTLGYIRDIHSKVFRSNIEQKCIDFCHDTVIPVMERVGHKNFNFKTSRYRCIEYTNNGWINSETNEQITY